MAPQQSYEAPEVQQCMSLCYPGAVPAASQSMPLATGWGPVASPTDMPIPVPAPLQQVAPPAFQQQQSVVYCWQVPYEQSPYPSQPSQAFVGPFPAPAAPGYVQCSALCASGPATAPFVPAVMAGTDCAQRLPAAAAAPQEWPFWTSCSAGVEPQKAADSSSFNVAGAALSVDAEPFMMEEQRSVASSNCSTAPSTRRRRKPRAPPAERKALAEKHKQVEAQAQMVLMRKGELTSQLEAGGASCIAAIEELQGAIWRLSTDVQGCRLVQKAVEKAKGAKRGEVVEELHGHVREAMGSPHANYVLQKVVEVMPIEIASFIAKELAGIAADACRHRYGCRIMCRLTEQFASAPCVAKLLDELMKDIAELTTHSFGHHVVHSILEHGPEKLRHAIAMELAADAMNTAMNRSGSSVMERALMHSAESDVEMLVAALLDGDVLNLAQSQFGIFVVKALMQMPGTSAEKVLERVEAADEEVRESKHYQRLQQLLLDEDDHDDEEDAA
eukprot:CAMPEP_0178459664 /NCGR_PEP_ID=MMETSP0689_2-20121128/48257_1 /TAXON_ID=160604 /ORGANISM="Amphidinium massartii, Strain CS-259" /LENGTH=500 /DNA_ID=CAMNT_0020086169 /DNA_START=102 /DNA_END=1604 /DNA_ORIENTATION=+